MTDPYESRWLFLIHRIPPKPAYFRVKIWRRLQGVGAVAVKNTVYVLPKTEQSHEDLRWVYQEVIRNGGDAVICEARFVDGLTDEQVEQLFVEARSADYQAVADEATQLLEGLSAGAATDPRVRSTAENDVARLRRRIAEVERIEFFPSPVKTMAASAVAKLEACLRDPEIEELAPRASGGSAGSKYRARTWVTRRGIHVDRIASAWLIRRFIDPEASFRWVPGKTHVAEAGELRFDMFEGEFTHDGDLCTFEVLVRDFVLDDPALRTLAEIIHDIDLKDSKFGRPETAGFERMLAGIALTHKDDDERLARGSALLDDLYEAFTRRGP